MGSNPSAAYWVVILSHLFVVKIVLFVWKRSKKTKKRPGLAHFLKKTSNGFSFENWTLLTYVPQETLINLWPILLILSIVIYFTSIVGGMGSNPPPPRIFPPSWTTYVPNFIKICQAVWISRENTQTDTALYLVDIYGKNFR